MTCFCHAILQRALSFMPVMKCVTNPSCRRHRFGLPHDSLRTARNTPLSSVYLGCTLTLHKTYEPGTVLEHGVLACRRWLTTSWMPARGLP